MVNLEENIDRLYNCVLFDVNEVIKRELGIDAIKEFGIDIVKKDLLTRVVSCTNAIFLRCEINKSEKLNKIPSVQWFLEQLKDP